MSTQPTKDEVASGKKLEVVERIEDIEEAKGTKAKKIK